MDGITASTVMFQGLTMLDAHVVNFIPNRLKDGYGFTENSARRCLNELTPDLIITVDCGINSIETTDMVQAIGVDVIITDHHEPGESYANALAVVDPKLCKDEELHLLAGVGVAYKLCQGLKDLGIKAEYAPALEAPIDSLLDIVAVGTVADVVPLKGDNRILVHHGLLQMSNTTNYGLRAMIEQLGLPKKICSQDIGFKIGPRINAAGRIGDPADALRLFISTNSVEACAYASKLDTINTERREIEKAVTEEVLTDLETYFKPDVNYGLVGVGYDYHAGIVGITAARVMERYNRPTIILNVNDKGFASGSCRSIPSFNILDALHHVKDLLVTYGGHKFAAGLKLRVEDIDEFTKRFNAYAKEQLQNIDITPILTITGYLMVEDINWDFYNQMQKLEPFGKDNPEPIWILENVDIVSRRLLGGNHLKIEIQTPEGRVGGIKFNYEGKLPTNKASLAFTIGSNTFRGETSLQLLIQDIVF